MLNLYIVSLQLRFTPSPVRMNPASMSKTILDSRILCVYIKYVKGTCMLELGGIENPATATCTYMAIDK